MSMQEYWLNHKIWYVVHLLELKAVLLIEINEYDMIFCMYLLSEVGSGVNWIFDILWHSILFTFSSVVAKDSVNWISLTDLCRWRRLSLRWCTMVWGQPLSGTPPNRTTWACWPSPTSSTSYTSTTSPPSSRWRSWRTTRSRRGARSWRTNSDRSCVSSRTLTCIRLSRPSSPPRSTACRW